MLWPCPYKNDFTIDHCRLAAQARWCLDAGCSSVTVFGTTGEGASVSLTERGEVLGALLSAGLEPGRQLVGGVAAASIGDAVEQIRMLNDAGCQRILLAPPFYFKGVSDKGLYEWFAPTRGKGCPPPPGRHPLPHPISDPSLATVNLIGRLKTAYPDLVMGVKDSGGEWAFTEALLANHGELVMLLGDQRHLAAGVRLGAKGAISGLANICPAEILPLVEHGKNDSRIVDLVNEALKYPVTPAVKALLARRRNDAGWFTVRPPLARVSNQDANELASAYDRIFSQEPG